MEPEKIVEMLRAEDNCDVLDYIEDAADCIEMLPEEIHNATVHADCMEAKASAYQAELEASQRRERAAVDSLTRMANGYKDCGDCAYIGHSIGKCEYKPTGLCYKWRGPEQEGE